MQVDVKNNELALKEDSGNSRRTNRTMHGLLWTFVGTGGQAVLQLLVLVIFAHLLSPENFGLVTGAILLIGMATIFCQMGIGPALVQRPNINAAHISVAFNVSVILGVLCAALLWCLAPWLGFVFAFDNFAPVLRAMSLTLPIQGLGVVAESLLQRQLRFRMLAIVELSAMFLGYGVFGVTLAVLGFGVWALVLAHLMHLSLKTAFVLMAQPHPLFPTLDRRALTELMRFGGGYSMAQVGNYVAGQGDNLVIGRFLGAVALGIYGRAYQLMMGPAVILGQVLDRVLFPEMAIIQSRLDHLAESYRRCVASMAILICPLSAVLWILAPELILVLLGREWDAVILPFRILVLGMLFRASYKISDSLIRAMGAVYRRAWRQAAYAVLVLVSAWIGHFWGLAGVATSISITLFINFLLMAHLSLLLTRMSWKTFASAHLPGLMLASYFAVGVGATATALRRLDLDAFAVIAIASLVVVLLCISVYFGFPFLLGHDGQWLLRTIGLSPGRSQRAKPLQPESAITYEGKSISLASFTVRMANGTCCSADSSLVARFFNELAERRICYCHWKGNYYFQKAWDGEDDLDLLVDPNDAHKFEYLLAELGFARALEQQEPNNPFVLHYYGVDPVRGSWVHLHVYYRLILGGNLLEYYHIPLESYLLKTTRVEHGVAFPSRSAELVLFVIRTLTKSSSWLELILSHIMKGKKDVQAELGFLLAEDGVEPAVGIIETELPSVSPSLFRECVAALRQGVSLLSRSRLARKLCRQLESYQILTPWAACRQQALLLMRGTSARVRFQRSRKVLSSGTAVIAFVGPDASGKSTLVSATTSWLGEVFKVKSAHLGKPPATWITWLPTILWNASRRLRGLFRSSKPTSFTGDSRAPGLLSHLRAVLLAWDRYCLAWKLRSRAVRSGELVVCDRYPSRVVGAMDSPRLYEVERCGRRRWYSFLARLEHFLYRQIPAPDIVFQLSSPIELALERNRTRQQVEPETYLRERHRPDQRPDFPLSKTFHLNTSCTRAEAIDTVRRLAWGFFVAREGKQTDAEAHIGADRLGDAAGGSSPRVVEFIGATGVGKTSLMTEVKEALARQGLKPCEAHDALLKQVSLSFIRNPRLQSFVVHFLVIPSVFRFLGSRKARDFLQLALNITLRDAANFRLAWLLLRNVVKRIGVHQVLTDWRRNLVDFDFILCDEGILHAAHNLFVHTTTSPDPQEILRFANLVPMPDRVIWVTAPPDQSIACILRRGHPRVGPKAADAKTFAINAHSSFNTLCSAEVLQSRLLRVHNSVAENGAKTKSLRERAHGIANYLAHTTAGHVTQPPIFNGRSSNGDPI